MIDTCIFKIKVEGILFHINLYENDIFMVDFVDDLRFVDIEDKQGEKKQVCVRIPNVKPQKERVLEVFHNDAYYATIKIKEEHFKSCDIIERIARKVVADNPEIRRYTHSIFKITNPRKI